MNTNLKCLDTTKSNCPICNKVIPAKIIEKQGKVFMEKTCPEHGHFSSLHHLISARLYKIMEDIFEKTEVICPSPLNCKECEKHKIKNTDIGLSVTGQCNINCPFCYFGNKKSIHHFIFEEIVEVLKSYPKSDKLWLGGGEPTTRDNLFSILSKAKNMGFDTAIITNGLKTSDPEYCKKLINTGIDTIAVSHEITSESYKTLRGMDVKERVDKTIEILENTPVELKLSSTINEGNFNHFCRFIEEKFSEGIKEIRLSPVYTSIVNEKPSSTVNHIKILNKIMKHFDIDYEDLYSQIHYRYLGEKFIDLFNFGVYRKKFCHIFLWFKKNGDEIRKINESTSFKIRYKMMKILDNYIFNNLLKMLPSEGFFKRLIDHTKGSENGRILNIRTRMNRKNIDLRYLQNCNGLHINKSENIKNRLPECYLYQVENQDNVQ